MKKMISLLAVAIVAIGAIVLAKQLLFSATIPTELLNKPVKYACESGVCETEFGTYSQFNMLTDGKDRDSDDGTCRFVNGTKGKLDMVVENKRKATTIVIHFDDNYVLRGTTMTIAGQSKDMNDYDDITTPLTMLGFKVKKDLAKIKAEAEKKNQHDQDLIKRLAGHMN